MGNIVGLLLSFLLLYKYVALFILVFIASFALPLPTNLFLMAAGAFASQGYFSFTISFVVALIANILGDCCDYYLAKKYGHTILHKLGIKVPSYIDQLDRYIKKHAGLTIFVTRFFGITGLLANFLAGFIDVPFIKFLFYDFLGNFVSTITILSSGYFLGNDWQNFSNSSNLPNYIIAFVIISIAIGLSLWHRKHRRKAV